MSQPQPLSQADPAALGSALLAGALTLALGEGKYDWFDLGVGLAMAGMLLGYYTPSQAAPQNKAEAVRAVARVVAFGAVSGLLLALIFSWPIQKGVGTPAECEQPAQTSTTREPSPTQETLPPTPQEVDNCAGEAADRYIGWVWLVAGVGFAAIHPGVPLYRRDRDRDPGPQPDPAAQPDPDSEPEPAPSP